MAITKSSSVLSGPLKIILFPGTPFLNAFVYSNPETTSAHETS